MDADGDLDLLCEDRRSLIHQFETSERAPTQSWRPAAFCRPGRSPLFRGLPLPRRAQRDAMNGYIDPRFCHWTAHGSATGTATAGRTC